MLPVVEAHLLQLLDQVEVLHEDGSCGIGPFQGFTSTPNTTSHHITPFQGFASTPNIFASNLHTVMFKATPRAAQLPEAQNHHERAE